MTTLRVTDDTTADDLRECITHLAAEAARLPIHFVEKRAAIHAHIDDLLEELQSRG